MSLQQAVDELRAQGADIVVALVHTGLPYDRREGYRRLKQRTYEEVIHSTHINAMEIAHFVKGIDILLGGHLHRGYQQPWEDPVTHTICLQNYAYLGNLGWIEVELHRPTRSIAGYRTVADGNALILLQEEEFWPDSVVAAFVREQQAIYEKEFREVIGEAAVSLTRSSIGEAPLNNLIADVMRERVKADFAFTNFGGIRAEIRSGPVTREDVFKVLPFGNEIVSFQASGRLIKQILERKLRGSGRGLVISGARVVFNRNLPDGQRVVYVEIGGKPLEPDRIYRVATSDYLIEGNSGLSMLRDIPRSEVAFSGILMREALIEYFEQHSPVRAKVDGRWQHDPNAEPSPEWRKMFPPSPQM
ncbi:MAG: bifunctional metallophosphatase/5'-nucleotidase [Calditrichaeota bacterium]|nr:MAG: bifunctional metallophosphatase/5'-nucleotidase [Calditrichota bacterium]